MKRFGVLALMCLLVFFARCSKNPVDQQEPIDPEKLAAADSIAQYWFQAIADTLVELEHKDTEGIRETEVAAIRNGFNSALTLDSRTPIAHLGLSILEILELNYSESVWEVVDSLDAWGGGMGTASSARPRRDRTHTLIGRQFSLLAEIPFSFSAATMRSFPPNITIAHIQQIIEETIMPALGRAIDHLAIVERNTKAHVTLTIRGDGEEETAIIDLGEIYFFDATLHALRAGFGFGIAYDCDLFGPDGTYGWIDDMRSLDDEDCTHFTLAPGASGDTLNLFQQCGSNAAGDSILMAVAHYNLSSRDEFLTLRGGGSVMGGVRTDLLALVGKLEGAVNFIKHVRPDETEQNIIKLTDLSELESDLGGDGAPNFAQGFESIEDVLDWARDFMSAPMQFSEELGPSHETFTWTMNIGALLTNPVQDWKDLLPYHRWTLPSGPWIERETWLSYEYWYGGYEYWSYVFIDGRCQYWTFNNVDWVRYYCRSENLSANPIELLNAPNGSPIDLEVERMPYFPDYTLHGVLPGMTRAKWLDLIDILD